MAMERYGITAAVSLETYRDPRTVQIISTMLDTVESILIMQVLCNVCRKEAEVFHGIDDVRAFLSTVTVLIQICACSVVIRPERTDCGQSGNAAQHVKI